MTIRLSGHTTRILVHDYPLLSFLVGFSFSSELLRMVSAAGSEVRAFEPFSSLDECARKSNIRVTKYDVNNGGVLR